MPRPEDFGLVDALAELVVPYPSPSASPAESSRVSPDNGVIDLTSDSKKED